MEKEDIYAAIAALEAEIDKDRTRLASIMDVVGKVIENPKISEAIQAVRKVISLLQDAKTAETKKAMLAAPVERKRIEDKRPASQKPKSFEKDLDDEIPF